jgi:molybdopterin molybdotransferase
MKKKITAVSVEEARNIVLNSITPLGFDKVDIFNAPGRVLFENIISDIANPPLDNSAMDGYAVIAEDTRGASINNPVRLKVIAEIQAGGHYTAKKVLQGTAIRIMTGGPIPEGADSVIQFEDTEEEKDIVKVFREINKHDNYRFAGEDIKKGDIVLYQGDRLSSAAMGLLSSLNYKNINVYKQPEVAIISTGNEIADIGDDIKPGQIRNSNSYTLYSEVKKYSAIPRYLGIVNDTMKDMKTKFTQAMESDIIISTGGVSMGKYDFVKDIYSEMGIEILFERVKVKPGRPCTFARKGQKLIFGLPGNPVSTMTSFIQFVRPAILKLMNAKKINKPIVNAYITEDITKEPGRLYLLRGYFFIKNNEFHVNTTGPQGSGILTSMSAANCLIILPENTSEVKAGEKVAIQLIDHDEIE